jgi:hypothetical protein
MNTSITRVDGARRPNGWLRRAHRWLGILLAAFVILFSCTGIAINHSDRWELNNRYVTWSWLLDAYGIRAPMPAASFADRGHHAALLGRRLYFDQREITGDVHTLTGLVVTSELALITTNDRAFVLTTEGDLIEQLDMTQQLPGGIASAGRLQNLAVVYSADTLYRSNADMTEFEAWSNAGAEEIVPSQATPLPEPILRSLQDQYRGRGLSTERLLTDLHSGRILGSAGTLFMDAIAVLLMILSATGIFMWMRGNSRRKGSDS